MNFKRNCLLIASLFATTVLVAGCSNDTSFKHFSYIKEVEDRHEEESYNDGEYFRYGDYSNFIAKDAANQDVELGSAAEVMRNYSNKKFMNTTGNQKLLVIPVDFEDFTCENLQVSKNEYVENLKKAFFGKQQNNKFVSVSEYFNRSSYGKLRLDGKVTDKFYTFPKKVQEIKSGGGLDKQIITSYYEDILDWYKSNYDDINDFVITGLDEDEENKKNIPIYLVYTYPIELAQNASDFFWAFTFPNCPISWSSYSFMYTEFGEPDAHTFIHETGHLLGLNDYYPTETSKTDLTPDPTGRIDMMDCSIGDETAFSKMYLNWARPYHVQKTADIVLKPFSESGNLILINKSWNKTVFDEYYLLEFYTPQGLNAYDSYIGNSEAKLPTLPGIKLYHVDSRLAYFEQSRNAVKLLEYCDIGGYNPSKSNITLAHDNNTYSNPQNKFQSKYLYELVLNNTQGKISGCAKDIHLYRAGDEITGLTLSSGEQLKYKITISSLNFKEATIHIDDLTEGIEI